LKEGIAFAGTIAVDKIKLIDDYPPESELRSINKLIESVGGAVSNCAISLAKIDNKMPIEIIANIGNDAEGRFILSELEKYENIDLEQLNIEDSKQTPFTDVLQNIKNKKRTYFTYKGTCSRFNNQTINFEKLKSPIIHIAYLLLLEELDKSDRTYGTKMAKLLCKAQELGFKTSIDIVSEKSERFKEIIPPSLKYTDYCIINEIEAGYIVGIELKNHEDNLVSNNVKKALTMIKAMGVSECVIIHCPEGSFGFDGDQYYSVPSLKVDQDKIKGTVGAGDAYCSGILYGMSKGLDIECSMELGTAAATTSLYHEDSVSGVLNYEELISLYKRNPKQQKLIIK